MSSTVDCPYCDAPLDPMQDACAACGGSMWIAGRFRIESMRGHGRTGAVYSALAWPDQTRVAVKVLSLSRADWKSAELFERGARALQGLQHRAVPQVYELSRDERFGRLMLVREYLDDDTLEERVKGGRHIDADSFRALLIGLLELARYLHGLVPPLLHRDIRPSNIMFRSYESWEPVLVDFDAMSGPERGDDTLHVAGTSGYAPPEQLVGDAVPASDLYAIGLTLVFVATHTEPESLRLEHRRDGERFALDGMLDALEPPVRELLTRLVERDPARRPQSAAEALALLELPAHSRPEPTYVPAANMAQHEIEARVEGWLALGPSGDRNPRLLVPYLARLEPISYARFRDAVARRGGIEPRVLDQSVAEARSRLASQRPARRRRAPMPLPPGMPPGVVAHVPARVMQPGTPPNLVRPHHYRRQPGSGSGAVTAIVVCATMGTVGAVVMQQSLALREQFGMGSDACSVDWLTVRNEVNQTCLLWGGAGNDPILLGCHAERQQVEQTCQALRAVPNSSPQTLDLPGAHAIAGIAHSTGLRPSVALETLLARLEPPTSTAHIRQTSTPQQPTARQPTPEPVKTAVPERVEQRPTPAQKAVERVELRLVSEPMGALIEIEGAGACSTPCILSIPSGMRPTMTVTHPGYKRIERRVYALSNKEVRFDLDPL